MTAALACTLLLASPAAAQVQPYGTNDYGGFRSILPPGQGRTVNAAEVAAVPGRSGPIRRTTTTSSRCTSDLVYATPGLTAAADRPSYFKDGSFGVQPADAEPSSTYSPRAPA